MPYLLLLSLALNVFFAVTYFFAGNNDHHINDSFVQLKNEHFYVDGNKFYPVVLNYIATPQINDHNEIWISPTNDYAIDFAKRTHSKEYDHSKLKADMELIKEMGFNTVRIVGVGDPNLDDAKKLHRISIGVYNKDNVHSSLMLADNNNYQKYLTALEELFDIVEGAGLKLIFLVRITPGLDFTQEHFIKIAEHFKENTTLLAYDLFNEPLYFDDPNREKYDAYKFVKKWKQLQKVHAPNHLITIGLEGIREVFCWDPNILSVDFISYHPYEYEPEQVRNELYWYGKYTKKPWIVGETAVPSNNDSVKYSEQQHFAAKTIKQAYNCGAAGYSWWQYKDVAWQKYHASYMGVVNRQGQTITGKNKYIIDGSVKPVADEFRNFTYSKDTCHCLDNYYNYSRNNKFRISGKITNEKDAPIEGAVVLAWNQWWSHSYHTVTKADGNFELYSDYPFYHWMASASMYSKVRDDINPDTARTAPDGIPTIHLGTLKIEKLTFAD